MQKTQKKSALFIGVMMIMLALMQLLAACGKNEDKPKPTIKVPVVDMDIIDTYLESGKPVTLLDAVDDKAAALTVKFTVGEGDKKKEMSAAEIGYNKQTTVWTPSVINQAVYISLTAKNNDGDDSGDKNVYVVEQAKVRPVSVLNEQVYIGEEVNLKEDFVTYNVVEAICNSATVTYMDGDIVKEDNTKGNFNQSTMRYTVNKAGNHKISITINGGLNRVTKQFFFLALDEGSYLEINYLDDLLGTYSAEDAASYGIPEGLPAGQLAKNATLKYKIMRDLDYNDPNSWVDGVIKAWVPVVASGERDTQQTGENSVFSGIIDGLGHTISNLTNVFPGRTKEVTVKRTWTENGESKNQDFTYPITGEVVNPDGFVFFNSTYANGTIRNLSFGYKTVLDSNTYTAYNNYSPINLAFSFGSDNATAILRNVNASGSINIDASGIEVNANDYSKMYVAGLAFYSDNAQECNVNVDITLDNMKADVCVGGVFFRNDKNVKDINYSGDIKVKMAAAGYSNDKGTPATYDDAFDTYEILAGGFSIEARGGSYSSSVADNVVTTGTIEVTTQTSEVTKNTNAMLVGGISSSSGGIYYNCSSDMNITVNKLDNTFSNIGGLFGNNKAELYGCKYLGGISIADLNSQENQRLDIGVAIGGIVGITSDHIRDCTFSGTISIGGKGYKEVGGIAGWSNGNYSDSGVDQYVAGNVSKGSVIITEGKFTYGGIAGRSAPGLGVSVHMENNLYFGTLVLSDTKEDSIAAGLVGVYRGTSSDKTALSMKGNDIYGGIAENIDSVKSYVLLGKLSVKNFFSSNNDGKYSGYMNNSTTVAGYEGEDVSLILSLSVSMFKKSKLQFFVEAESNRNSDAYPTDIRWIASLSDEEKQELQDIYKQYCTNLDEKIAYIKVGEGYTNIYSTMWEDLGLVTEIDGQKYIKVAYRIYNDEEVGKLCSQKPYGIQTDEVLAASKVSHSEFIDALINWVDEISTRQDKVN
jgi:hypothetical protein